MFEIAICSNLVARYARKSRIKFAQTLIILGAATVFVGVQFVNFGAIAIAQNGQLNIGAPGRTTAFVNAGTLTIVPTPGFASPGVSNYGQMQNFGVIFNTQREGVSAIFNNFGTITNANQIINRGFFHNSGPPVQENRAEIDNVGDGYFDNQGGTLENLGVIAGRVF